MDLARDDIIWRRVATASRWTVFIVVFAIDVVEGFRQTSAFQQLASFFPFYTGVSPGVTVRIVVLFRIFLAAWALII